jgi:glycine dehydrogenase subunit 2
MARYDEPLLSEIENREIKELETNIIPKEMQRKTLNIPTLTERAVVQHFIHLSQMNYGVDTGMYPLGSCTMKYNPKLLEKVVQTEKIEYIHPLQNEKTIQGCLQILYELEKKLCSLTGMDAFCLQPAAGAHGEFLGMLITRAYHEANKEKRQEVILPDSAHGTNPASAKMAGYDIIEIPSKNGRVDITALNKALSERTAAFMLTNPNTLGIFEQNILKISKEVKKVGALLYYDGANMNAILGKACPADMGFDIVHLNLHKTFATPHGGGGPGAGPVGVKSFLKKFLPVPRIIKNGGKYSFKYDKSDSIGKISQFYGNFTVLLKAFTYILLKGRDGLETAAENAVLNANYLLNKLNGCYDIPFSGRRMHEFVISAKKLRNRGIRALDVAKRLLDYGIHPPTMYFPLIVEEALMIEPTESESIEALKEYANVLKKIAEEDTTILKNAPHTTPVKRMDEARASKNLIVTWKEISKLR